MLTAKRGKRTICCIKNFLKRNFPPAKKLRRALACGCTLVLNALTGFWKKARSQNTKARCQVPIASCYLQKYFSAHHFHYVAAHAHIHNLAAIAAGAKENAAAPLHLHALLHQRLLVRRDNEIGRAS